MTIRRKRIALAVALGFGSFGVFASAASLGGLTSSRVGSENAVVASCDSDGVTITYTTAYDAADSRYEVTTATVAGVAAGCAGQTLSVTLKDGTGASIGAGTMTAVSGANAVAIAPNSSAQALVGASVIIAG